jgi:4-alpha-glucanotransferase
MSPDAKPVLDGRRAGILLHPTSLPGPYGIGDLGEWAYRFVDTLAAAGQKIWQTLPLGPTGFAESPYQCLSAFAGNTNLISLDKLVEWGWLERDDLADPPHFSAVQADYAPAIKLHDELLSLAYDRFVADAAARADFEARCYAEDQGWLDDFALFAALKEFHGGRPWPEWTEGEALHEKEPLRAARRRAAATSASGVRLTRSS